MKKTIFFINVEVFDGDLLKYQFDPLWGILSISWGILYIHGWVNHSLVLVTVTVTVNVTAGTLTVRYISIIQTRPNSAPLFKVGVGKSKF